MKQKSKKDKGREKRRLLVFSSGARCAVCGYTGIWALQFHHHGRKRFTLSARSLSKIEDVDMIIEEWTNCILLCSNCHSGYHAGKMTEQVQRAVVEFQRFLNSRCRDGEIRRRLGESHNS